jgi:hypothetical protein
MTERAVKATPNPPAAPVPASRSVAPTTDTCDAITDRVRDRLAATMLLSSSLGVMHAPPHRAQPGRPSFIPTGSAAALRKAATA